MNLSALLKFNYRYYRRHGILSLLCLAGIALGVGVIVAVELINDSALGSFTASVDFLSGNADCSIVSEQGRIDERRFAAIWTDASVKAAAPVIEVTAVINEAGGEPIRFMGIDPFLDRKIRSFAPQGGPNELTDFFHGRPPGVFLSRSLTEAYGFSVGREITVPVAGVEKKLRALGPLPGGAAPGVEDRLAVMDIAAAQEVFGRYGTIDRIDIVLSGSMDALRRSLPADLRIVDTNTRKSTLQAMLYSFQLNLAAMSLIALFVGTFLIYNFSMFSVLSRRRDMSLLLTLGADKRELVAAFVIEALVFGALGSMIGVMCGYVLAHFSIERVSSTISELYSHIAPGRVRLTWGLVSTGMAVGFTAVIAGTILPALEVAGAPPIMGMKHRTIEDRVKALKPFLALGGAGLLAVSMLCAYASRYSIFWGFSAAFGVTLGFALCAPWFIALLGVHGGAWLKRVTGSLIVFLAARTITASLSRTGISIAALSTALSMTIGVDTMIHSFRCSVSSWLEGSLQGDLYISPGSTKWKHSLPDELITMLYEWPDVDAVERYSTFDMYLQDRPIKVRVIDGATLQPRAKFTFLKGDDGSWENLKAGEVFISESLGYRFGLTMGDYLELAAPKGRVRFRVASVIRDYSSDQGVIQMDRNTYNGVWGESGVQSAAVFMKPGASTAPLKAAIASQFTGLEKTMVSNTKMREDILVIFDKTFAPTATLKGVSLIVALLGVATALTAVLIERAREVTLMGYLGLTPGEIAGMNVTQAALMGVIAFMMSVACGLLLSWIIIHAINYRSFGWSVDVHLSSTVFIRTFALTMAACVAASVYPTLGILRWVGPSSVTDE